MTTQPPPLLAVHDIHKRFAAVEAVRGVDLTVASGQVVALLGDNGAGKSTLVKIIAGVFPQDKGLLEFAGQRKKWRSPRDSRAAGIEVVYQDLGLVPWLSIARNFFLGKELTTRWGTLDLPRMRTIAQKCVAELGISLDDVDRPVGRFSGGQQKAVAIARSLYFGVRLMILDEPTAALSVGETRTVLRVVSDLRQRGIAVILITHNMHHALEVADRFVVVSEGKKVLDANRDEVDHAILERTIVDGVGMV
ncbi:MAG: ABC transporter ATP-binding protein [Planctomycetaceae bacterium]|nr:ABC transporter ATP-binding protein [Planctomycetaceae bacterium]MCH2595883.1 ATP-binding cassette domain-containing protein [Pirellulales bacterium]HCK40571.1 ABC transporter ATP-binding protein [Planctomycetaceae bacterium]